MALPGAWCVWALFTTLVVVGVWKWMVRTGELIAPRPIFLGTIALYTLPRSAYLLWFERAPLTSGGLLAGSQHWLILETLALCAAGTVAFLVGHSRLSAIRTASSIDFTVPSADPNRAFWISAAAIAIGITALLYLIIAVGGLSYALRHQFELGTLLATKQPVFQLTRLLLIPIALLLIDEERHASRISIWVLAIVASLLLFPLGRRMFLVVAVGYPIALYHLLVRPIRIRWLISGAVLFGTLVFSLGYLRLLGTAGLSQAASVFRTSPSSVVHFMFNGTGELKIFDAATIIVRDVPDEFDFTMGKTFLRVPVMVIPRAAWTTKPVTLGEVIVSRYLPQLHTGYPPLAIGEFYAAAGPFGVILGCFLLGWVSRVAWEWWLRNRGPGNASLYLAFCFFVFDFVRVGDPSRTMWFFILGSASLIISFSASASRTHPIPEPAS